MYDARKHGETSMLVTRQASSCDEEDFDSHVASNPCHPTFPRYSIFVAVTAITEAISLFIKLLRANSRDGGCSQHGVATSSSSLPLKLVCQTTPTLRPPTIRVAISIAIICLPPTLTRSRYAFCNRVLREQSYTLPHQIIIVGQICPTPIHELDSKRSTTSILSRRTASNYGHRK
jgi:hypothetical protein